MDGSGVASVSVSAKTGHAVNGDGRRTPSGEALPSGVAVGGGSIASQALAVFALALLVRLLGNSSLPIHVDEFYHLLAGQSWAENGSLTILDGAYPRAWGYTVLTGLTFLTLGQADMFVARLPALLAGALLVPTVFVWVAGNVTRRAAWVAALLLCFADVAIEVSQFARFYSLHALLIWLGSIATYGALHHSSSIRSSLLQLIGAAVCFLGALHLQVTTLILLAGLGLYIAGYTVSRPPVLAILSEKRYRPWLIFGAIAFSAVVFAGALNFPMAGKFRKTSYWAAEHQDDVLFYVRIFLRRLPVLTLIFPLSVWLVVSRRSRVGYFCLALFLIPFVGHSLAGMKGIRYMVYALPFFFVLIAVAADFLLSALSRFIEPMLAKERQWPRVPARFHATVLAGSLALAVFVGMAANPAIAHGLKRVAIDTYRVVRDPSGLVALPPDEPWTGAVPRLRSAIASPSLLVVADDLRTAHYLGAFDLLINRSRISDISPQVEFGRDFRTGRRVVGSGSTLAEIAACYPDGVIVVPDERWELGYAVSREVTAAIESFARPVAPGVEGFHLFRWQHAVRGERCGELRDKIADHSAH